MYYSRKCIVSNQIYPVEKLIRFVKLQDGKIVVQFDQKIAGRGAYCLNDPLIIEQLFKRKLLNHSFKTNISNEVYLKLKEEVEVYVKKQKEKNI